MSQRLSLRSTAGSTGWSTWRTQAINRDRRVVLRHRAPFERHGVASALLDHVIRDAASRGASWIKPIPTTNLKRKATPVISAARARSIGKRGFVPVEERDGYTVMRRPVD